MESTSQTCSSCGSIYDIVDGHCQCGYDPSLETATLTYKAHNAISARLDMSVGNEGISYHATTGQTWGLEVEGVKKFIVKAEKKFRLKQKNYGFISKNDLPVSTAFALKQYLLKKIDFKDFVSAFMQNIKTEASLNQKKPSGGAIIFIHYHLDKEEDSLGQMFIIMVDNSDVFKFDENLIPQILPSIDMNSLRQAVLVDLTLFDAIYSKNIGEPYLQFISGKSNSNFFKKAIGCESDLDNKRSVDEARRALKDFSAAMNLPAVDKVNLLNTLDRVMSEARGGKLSTGDIERKLDAELSKHPNAIGKFEQFTLIGKYKIDAFFEPGPKASDSFRKVFLTGDNKDYSCSITVGAIRTKDDPNVIAFYDKSTGTLSIKLSDSDQNMLNDIFHSDN